MNIEQYQIGLWRLVTSKLIERWELELYVATKSHNPTEEYALRARIRVAITIWDILNEVENELAEKSRANSGPGEDPQDRPAPEGGDAEETSSSS